MASTLGGETIYVDQDSDWQGKPSFGQINPIGATTTILHDTGMPSYTRSIGFWILNNGVHDALLALTAARGAINYTCNHDGNQGNVMIMSYSPRTVQALNYAFPVYYVTVELMKR